MKKYLYLSAAALVVWCPLLGQDVPKTSTPEPVSISPVLPVPETTSAPPKVQVKVKPTALANPAPEFLTLTETIAPATELGSPKSYTVALPDGTTTSTRGYDVDQFDRALGRLQDRLQMQLTQSHNAGLASYVHADSPHARDFPVTHSTTGMSFIGKDVVDQFEASFRSLQAFMVSLSVATKLLITLNVRSIPSDAVFELCTYESQCRQSVADQFISLLAQPTDFQLKDWRRGLYWYHVRKQGFKDIYAPINLVTFEGKTVECSLVSAHSLAYTTPCKLIP